MSDSDAFKHAGTNHLIASAKVERADDDAGPVTVTIYPSYQSGDTTGSSSKVENFNGTAGELSALIDHAERQGRKVVIYDGSGKP